MLAKVLDTEVKECAKCGLKHIGFQGGRGCSAHKTNGQPCPRYPIKGGLVCPRHGGSAKNVKAVATLRVEEQKAKALLVKMGEPDPIGHPVYELLRLAGEVRDWQKILRERVEELQSLELVDNFGVERERAVVTLYTRAQEQNARLLIDMAKLDLQSRALALQHDAAVEVMSAVSEVLRRLGLAEMEPRFRTELAGLLRDGERRELVR
jgi:HEPN domain-containing protein